MSENVVRREKLDLLARLVSQQNVESRVYLVLLASTEPLAPQEKEVLKDYRVYKVFQASKG